MKTILIAAEVIETNEGSLLVRLNTGFGSPELRMVEAKRVIPACAECGSVVTRPIP